MRKKYCVGMAYGFIHFSVEVASFYFLYSRMAISPIWWALALFYDAIAFLPQGLLGSITDRFPKFNLGLLGSLLMLAALLIKGELFSLFLLAFGNAMIHAAGAQHTLRDSHGKITPNAIFVGGGSFGVITGQLLGGLSTPALLAIPLGLMALSCVAICIIHKKDDLEGKLATFNVAAPRPMEIIVLFAFIGVAVRSYTAYAIPTEWKKTVPQAIALFVCMGIGKTLGGVLCDKVGFRRVTLISLLGGLPFLLAGNDKMVLSLIGVALFSMTMPITVAVLASVFPKRPGFAFGITTTGLFMGVAPAFFIRPESLLTHQILIIVLTAAALPAILLSIKKGA
jgi:hypothetical protein